MTELSELFIYVTYLRYLSVVNELPVLSLCVISPCYDSVSSIGRKRSYAIRDEIPRRSPGDDSEIQGIRSYPIRPEIEATKPQNRRRRLT